MLCALSAPALRGCERLHRSFRRWDNAGRARVGLASPSTRTGAHVDRRPPSQAAFGPPPLAGVRGGPARAREQLQWGTPARRVGRVLRTVEGGGVHVPREVFVPALPPDLDAISEVLGEAHGSIVSVRLHKRGDKRALMDTVHRNAEQALAAHRLRRGSDLTSRSKALAELQEALGLDEAPHRIEAFDISTLQGTDTAASMVVFEDGLPRKSEYRKFTVRTMAEGMNRDAGDVAAMHEVISRRFLRHLEAAVDHDADALREAEGKPPRFAYQPHLGAVAGAPAYFLCCSSTCSSGFSSWRASLRSRRSSCRGSRSR